MTVADSLVGETCPTKEALCRTEPQSSHPGDEEKTAQPRQSATESESKYSLSEEEFKCVLQLKKLCDSEGVRYDSLYELAKYQIG